MRPYNRILINVFIQVVVFALLSIIFWNKSGGDIGLVFMGIVLWLIHLLISFRWIAKNYKLFLQILISLVVSGCINIVSFKFQRNFKQNQFDKKETVIEVL